MKYYTLSDENKKKLVKMELDIRRNAIALAEDVKKVVIKFDGKQLTKRLQTELQKIDGRLYVRNDYNSLDIIFTEYDNRSIITDKGCYYVNNNSFTLAGTAKSNAYGDSSTTDDNKIIAATLIASIDKQVDYMTAQIKTVESELKKIDQYKKRKQKIKQDMENYRNSITYTIKQYFDLDL